MLFEYDENKSKTNKIKHGIDFEEAKILWKDPNLLELPSKQEFEDEKRYLILGKINDKNYTAIITYRGVKIRIISVRRSRKKEAEFYESYTNR